MDRIVVGVDGSPASAAALGWAAAVGQATGASLTVATVYVADPEHVLPWDEALEWAGARLEEWCEPARMAGIVYDPHILHGENGPALLRFSRDVHASLVVVSRRSTDVLTALTAGSTADYIAHHAACPFAILPPAVKAHVPTHVVAGLDGSPEAHGASFWCAELAARVGASATVVYAPAPTLMLSTSAPEQRMEAYEALDGWAAPFRARDVKFTCEIVDGSDPARELVTVALDTGGELIVVGSRPVAGLRPIRLGGTTMRLVHRAPVPVVVVPRH